MSAARGFAPWLGTGRRDSLGAMVKRPDMLLAATLAVLALVGLFAGYDVHLLVVADSLYPVQMVEHGILDYRPPPPNRVFPDVGLHWLASFAITDPLSQKLAVGIALFAVTGLLVGLFKGPTAFALVMAVMLSNGFEVFNSATHYSLPLCVLLYQAVHGRRFEGGALFVLVYSNPLILLPLAFVLIEPRPSGVHLRRLAVVGAAMALNTLHSEFSETLVQMLVLFPVWYAGLWLASRLGLMRLAMMAACIVLPLAALAGLVPARYGVPVAASLLVLLLPNRVPAFDWRYLAFPAAAAAVFALTADWQRQDRMVAGYQCLAGELAARDITTIAAEHWTAKPLDFVARAQGQSLAITQTDFADSSTHAWMAPHSYYGTPTRRAVRSADTCENITTEATYCGQAQAAEVVDVTPLCGGLFELYRYADDVPRAHAGRPAGKLEAIRHNLGRYVGKAREQAGL